MKRPSDWMISRLVFLQLQESGIPVLRGRNVELVPLFCHQCLRDFSLMAITHFWLSFLLFPAFLVQNGSFTLVVNIKSKDGEIVQQTFSADPEKDFVTIDYKSNENRFVSVYIDFRQVCVKASLLKIFFKLYIQYHCSLETKNDRVFKIISTVLYTTIHKAYLWGLFLSDLFFRHETFIGS